MTTTSRLHALDAVRAFALLLGVVFHAGFSFVPGMIPGLWAAVDASPSTAVSVLLFTSHIFRMSLFFLVAGFFGRMLFHRSGARGFWTNRATRILVPLVVGWLLLMPATTAVWIWGITATFGGTPPAPPADLPAPPRGAFPLLHLWFLYYLLLLYVAVTVTHALVVSVDRRGTVRRTVDSAVQVLVRSGVAVVALATPTAIALYMHDGWVRWFGIPTPDRSFIPDIASLIAYGTAFSFGWLMQRQADVAAVWSRQWLFHLMVATAATGVCLSIGGLTPTFVPAPRTWSTAIFALTYALAIWTWTFAILGMALRFLSRPVGVIRYVADASYWIYLVHLPLVAALQVLAAPLAWHWSIKFPAIVLVSLALLVGSYGLFVRSTFIGQMLNGRRYPRWRLPRGADDVVSRTSAAHESADDATAADGEAAVDSAVRSAPESGPVASLSGAHKRYGTVTALEGLDLDVAPGQVLAVLGPNGAGKSTAIALWLGLLEPDAGVARLFAGSPLDVERRRRIGVMMQDVELTPELRVRELIHLTSSYYPAPLTLAQTLEVTGIHAIAGRKYAALSGGQKRQVQFALAICGNPSLLFLDEPTVGLDVEARHALWQAIRQMVARGCAVVLTTHYLEEAEALADRVAVLAAGRLIASGSVDDIRSLVSRTHISCTTVLTAEEVRTWPDVVSAHEDARRLRITATHAESVVRQLLAADDTVGDLDVRQAGLAEAFTELTRKVA